MNEVTITGNLTRDAELRTTANGKTLLKFSIAYNEKPYTKGGVEVKEVSYFDVTAWGELANDFGWLTKGARVTVGGCLKQDRWEKDGAKMSKVYINAFKINAEDDKPKPKEAPKGDKDFTDDVPF